MHSPLNASFFFIRGKVDTFSHQERDPFGRVNRTHIIRRISVTRRQLNTGAFVNDEQK